MAYSLPYTALLTIDEVLTAAGLSMQGSGQAEDTVLRDQVRAIIQGVTSRIEQYLERRLIVRSVSQRFVQGDWWYDDVLEKYVYYASQWPVVQAVTSSLDKAADTDGVNRLAAYTSDSNLAGVFFAGYRRADQTLTYLQGQSGLSAMTTAPEVLPFDIQQAAMQMCLLRIRELQRGVGLTSITREVGSATVQTTKLDVMQNKIQVGVDERALASIVHHKKMI